MPQWSTADVELKPAICNTGRRGFMDLTLLVRVGFFDR